MYLRIFVLDSLLYCKSFRKSDLNAELTWQVHLASSTIIYNPYTKPHSPPCLPTQSSQLWWLAIVAEVIETVIIIDEPRVNPGLQVGRAQPEVYNGFLRKRAELAGVE